jgi:hypothetical protein
VPPPDPWRVYAAGSEIRHFADFAREHLIQSEDRWEGKPLKLEPWQRRMLGGALAYERHGQPPAPGHSAARQAVRLLA